MTSNRSRSRVLNLMYRMISSIEGNNADIERSGVYRHYHVNKYCISVSLENNKTKELKCILENKLAEKGFRQNDCPVTSKKYLVSSSGVSVSISDAKDLMNHKHLDVFIF